MLVSLIGAGETYLTARPGGARRLDGLAMIHGSWSDSTIRRRVETTASGWVAQYRFDEEGHLVHVDGVDLTRDPDGRVGRCDSNKEDHDWRNACGVDAFIRIDREGVSRRFTWSQDRVVAVSTDGAPLRAPLRRGRAAHRAPVASGHAPSGRAWPPVGADRPSR